MKTETQISNNQTVRKPKETLDQQREEADGSDGSAAFRQRTKTKYRTASCFQDHFYLQTQILCFL